MMIGDSRSALMIVPLLPRVKTVERFFRDGLVVKNRTKWSRRVTYIYEKMMHVLSRGLSLPTSIIQKVVYTPVHIIESVKLTTCA